MHYCYSTCVFMCIFFGVTRCPFLVCGWQNPRPGLFTFCRVFALGRWLDLPRCTKMCQVAKTRPKDSCFLDIH